MSLVRLDIYVFTLLEQLAKNNGEKLPNNFPSSKYPLRSQTPKRTTHSSTYSNWKTKTSAAIRHVTARLDKPSSVQRWHLISQKLLSANKVSRGAAFAAGVARTRGWRRNNSFKALPHMLTETYVQEERQINRRNAFTGPWPRERALSSAAARAHTAAWHTRKPPFL